MPEIQEHDTDGGACENPEEEVDIHFRPIVNLQLVDVKTNEEDEEEILTLRAKLFRFDVSGADNNDLSQHGDGSSAPHNESSYGSDTSLSSAVGEWKERGVGNVKLLRHKLTGQVRVLMRRDKTLKLCANHYVYSKMELKPSAGSDRAWLWSTPADFSEDSPRAELLAIRFANAENAQKFKEKVDEARTQLGRAVSTPSKECVPVVKGAVDEADIAKIDTKVAELSVSS